MKRITIDGNTAAAHIAYHCNDISFIYPITPSSNMSESCDLMRSQGVKNVFGMPLSITEMQSEAGAAGAMHGALSAGQLATTFTSSQGLLLMIPNMYKIAGEHLPNVIFVASRSLATHALNIFCDHSDIYACLKTGYNIIACNSVQEVNDLALATQIGAIKSSLPFICFFDGFRTSHELNTIDQFTAEEIKSVLPMKEIESFRSRGLTPSAPICKGTAQNPDVFFQNRMASKPDYDKVIENVNYAFDKINTLTGKNYHTLDYVGDPKAENVIIALGSSVNSCISALKLRKKCGVVQVRLFAPFDEARLKEILPKTAKNITILDRNADFVNADSLYNAVLNACNNQNIKAKLFAGVYGLGGKEFDVDMALAVYDNMCKGGKVRFTVGINDDISNTSLEVKHEYLPDESQYCVRVYGIGSDGSVSASKSLGKILSKLTNKYSQSYFEYDSKKSGSMTTSHIRLDDQPITEAFNSNKVDFLMINNSSFINKFPFGEYVKDGGKILANMKPNSPISSELVESLKEKNIEFYSLDATTLAFESGLNNKINNIMLAGFFDLVGMEDGIKELRNSIKTTLAKKGESVVNANLSALDKATLLIHKLLYDNTHLAKTKKTMGKTEFYEKIMRPIASCEGNKIPVSAFSPDGSMPTGTADLEKRGIADKLPCWISGNCIQCNRCAFVCPHSAIRPKLIPEGTKIPKDYQVAKAFGNNGSFSLQVSPLDCTGCGLCAQICPSRQKAIEMKNYEDCINKHIKDYAVFNKQPIINPFDKHTVKGSQFEKNYFEYSGACAGCGETPYIKLVSQLFGDRMIVANATGCSSIYSASFPSCPYTKDKNGFGPAWANSLFEDNAEYGLGIALAKQNARQMFIQKAKNDTTLSPAVKKIVNKFVKNQDNAEVCKSCLLALKDTKLKLNEKYLVDNGLMQKPSIWIIGGDGWAYDIGFGGLDHVLASGENVNILVLDTELYSNTGGQTSKATPRGSVAKFSADGKRTKKKDLPNIALTYGNVYVANVCLGADPNQLIRAVVEAESYDGPSIIFAYAPCINHGINMKNANKHQFNAVASGYVTLFRYDPRLEQSMQIDSGEPTLSMHDYLMSENRYASLYLTNPSLAENLQKQCEIDAIERRNNYKKYIK
ncbi:MAG: pyruvate:ferredoxin (flavodoxin) oxidoreductase [Clostridia bacterium]